MMGVVAVIHTSHYLAHNLEKMLKIKSVKVTGVPDSQNSRAFVSFLQTIVDNKVHNGILIILKMLLCNMRRNPLDLVSIVT